MELSNANVINSSQFIKFASDSSSFAVVQVDMVGDIKKRKDLTLEEKRKILENYDKLPKMSQRSAANRLRISQPVLCKILKNRSGIENLVLTRENMNRKRARSGKDSQVESALKTWFLEEKAAVNGALIREKAEELARAMGRNNFSATSGWLNRWKKRENIMCKRLRLFGESVMVDKCEPVLNFSPKIKEESENGMEKEIMEPPSNAEMWNALCLLRRGLRHRTNNMNKYYEYEEFVRNLLQKKD